MASSLARRVVVAAFAIPATFAAVYAGGWVLAALIATLGAVGCAELFRMTKAEGGRPLVAVGYFGAVGIPAAAYLMIVSPAPSVPLWVLVTGALWLIAVMMYAVLARTPAEAPIASVAVTVFGPLYAAGLPSFILLIRHGAGSSALSPLAGTWLVFYPLVMTWICDSLAMAGGSLIGGPKLAPVISPNKTWAGMISGLGGAVVVAVALSTLVLARFEISLTVLQAIVLGLAVGVLGQIGDLAESLLKRSAGMKDSGSFFPGHGGVLDRLDSLYWVLPITASLLYAFGVL